MWTCEHCGQTVDEDNFEACWRCGTSRPLTDVEKHALLPEAPGDDEYAPVAEAPDDDDMVAVFLAIERGVRTVLAHPVVLVAAVPLILWRCAATVFGPSIAGFFPEPLTSLDWHTYLALLPDALLFGPTSTGLATLLVYAAAKGPISVEHATSVLLRRFPAVVVASSAVEFLFIVSLGGLAMAPRFAALPMMIELYVQVRLTFWASAVLVDGLDVIAGARRAWALARGNWWRLCALTAILVIAKKGASRFLPGPAVLVLELLLAPVGNAIVTSAYLQRIGLLPRPRPLASPLGGRSAPAFPSP